MKPPKFSYMRPNTLTEALELLAEHGEDAKIMSGGQSLIPILNMRLSTPKYLIDLGRVQELRGIREEDGMIVIGATTLHREVEESELIREKCPLLSEAIRWVGHSQIRNRGTIGGSIAHADPSAEMPCVFSVLRGELVIASQDDEFTVTSEEFFLSYLLTSLEPTQMVKEVRFPIMSQQAGYAFEEIARRSGDFALVETAVVIELDEDGTISKAQIAVGGASPVPFVMEESEDFLIGKEPTDETLKEAAILQIEDLDAEGDIHGSADYRRQLAGVMVERALQKAVKRCKGGVSV